jgi:hypothetical protein
VADLIQAVFAGDRVAHDVGDVGVPLRWLEHFGASLVEAPGHEDGTPEDAVDLVPLTVFGLV